MITSLLVTGHRKKGNENLATRYWAPQKKITISSLFFSDKTNCQPLLFTNDPDSQKKLTIFD